MSKIPEWAMDAAASLRSAVVWQSNASNEIIALALVEAERRGAGRMRDRIVRMIEDGQEALDPLDNYQSTWMQDWDDVEALVAAIRQLAEADK